jgi:hypothetical protein
MLDQGSIKEQAASNYYSQATTKANSNPCLHSENTLDGGGWSSLESPLANGLFVGANVRIILSIASFFVLPQL